MSEEKIVKLEKISSMVSIILLAGALVSILIFHSTVILPYVFALLYVAMMTSQVVLPVVRYSEIFMREKKMFWFPVGYGLVYTFVFAVFFYSYVSVQSNSNAPFYVLIVLLFFQMFFPMYTAIMKVTDRFPNAFPLYYEDLQAKKEAERRRAEEERREAEEALRKIEEEEKKELEEHPEKAVSFEDFFFSDEKEDKSDNNEDEKDTGAGK